MSWLPIPQSFHYIRLHRQHCPYQVVILQSRKWRKQQQWIECAVKTDRKIKPLAHSMLDAQYLFISLGRLKEVCFHRSYLVQAQRNAYEPGVIDSTELVFSEAWIDAISRQVGKKWLVCFSVVPIYVSRVMGVVQWGVQSCLWTTLTLKNCWFPAGVTACCVFHHPVQMPFLDSHGSGEWLWAAVMTI